MANEERSMTKDKTDKRYMKVFGNKVVIRSDQDQQDTVRESGLILPNNEPEDSRGVIIAVGHEVDLALIKPGDRVIYNSHAGSEIIWGGRNFEIMRDQDIMLVEASYDDPYFKDVYHEEGLSWMVDLSERKA